MSVERSALSIERSAAIAAIDRDNPWPGLATFTEDQGAYFHGRDDEIDDLTQLARLRALVVLFGQSGLGKSSLLQAGVFPRLRKAGFCPVYIRLDHAENAPSPTDQIKTLLLAETARMGAWTKPDAAKPGETLWELFHHRDDRLLDASGGPIIPVLVFDQFEELFTLGAAAGARRDRAVAFMAELAELVENRPSEQLVARLEASADELEAFDFSRADYRVVITLREDFLPDLEGMKTIMPALMANRMRLARMTGTQALQAVVKPGAGLVTEEVAAAVVEFVAGARGGSIERLAELNVEPALLSVVCRELNERRRTLGQAQITADLVSGNRREILTDFYDRSVADLPAPMRVFVEDRLLTKSGFRDNLALEAALEFPGVTQPLIDTLVARRLLRIEDRAGIQRVELTHDVLAEVIRASRDERQQRLALAAAEEQRRLDLAAAARQTWRQRWLIAALVAAVAALSLGAVFGIRAQRQAAAQSSQTDLAFGSRLLDEQKLGEGLAYLVRAGTKDRANPLIAPRLLTALNARNFALPTGAPLPLPSPGISAVISTDGRWIYAQGEDDVVRVINAHDWKMERELAFGQKVRREGVRVALKNDAVFAVGLEDGSMLVCDAATGRPLLPPIKPPADLGGRATNFALSPDGRWLALGGPTTLWVWETATGALRASLPNEAGYSRAFAFSPDSQRVVTTHGARITQMWSLPDGAAVGSPILTSNYVFVPAFSEDGRRLLVWHSAGVTVCDAATGDPIRPVIPVNYTSTQSVWLTPDGSRLVYSSSDRTINVLDVASGKPVFPPLVHGGLVLAAEFRRDGRVLFTNSVEGLFRLWDLETGKLLAEPTWKQTQFTPAVCSPDGSTVAVFSAAGPAYRLRLGRGAAAPLVLPRVPGSVLFANFLPDPPARLYWLTPTDVKVIDVVSGRFVEGGFKFPTPIPPNNVGSMRSSYGDTLGAGQILIPRMAPGVYRAWTWGERGITNDVPMQGVPARVASFLQNQNGNLAASFGSEDGGSVGIWNTRTGARLSTISIGGAVSATRNGQSVSTMLFSPDEKRIAVRTAPDQIIHVYDVGSGKELAAMQLSGRSQLSGFRFQPDNAHLLTGDTWGGVQVWEAATGKLMHARSVHRTNVTRFEFSPDGRHYASLSTDGSVQIWAASTHTPVGDMLSFTGRAARASFSPISPQISTPSGGATARIWDIGSGLPLNEPMEHPGEAVAITAFSPDGAYVSTTTDANAAGMRFSTLWPAPPDGRGARTPKWLLQVATIAAGRKLTADGKFVPAVEEFALMEEIQREIAAQPATDAYAAWAKWFLSIDAARSIAPGFTITPADAKKLADTLSAAAPATTAPTQPPRN